MFKEITITDTENIDLTNIRKENIKVILRKVKFQRKFKKYNF
jgi:hypothetical protein